MGPKIPASSSRRPHPTAHPFTDTARHKWWKRNWDVVLVAGALMTLLIAVFTIALLFLLKYWESLPSTASPIASRNLEVIKTCLQVMGVVCVGAFVTLGGAALESARRKRAEREAGRREDFETRTAILDRAMRCAQGMFVACQNARRRFDDLDAENANATDAVRQAKAEAMAEIQRELDDRYIDFGVEARAIQTIIGARYTTVTSPVPMPNSDTPEGIQLGEDQAWWRWHQVYDLLVVYYFSISGNFRKNVLRTNSRGHNGEFHAGYDFHGGARFRDADGGTNYAEIEQAIRYEVPLALAEFAASVTGKPAPARPGDPQ